MRAFIVRPFGLKDGINFDQVEASLIAPALDRAGISGRTTGEIVEAGNIRVDMFELLLIADLVIADISIHNANVFYELGIRHALRARQTILIRAESGKEPPFDLLTDRYMKYDPAKLSECVDTLLSVIGQTRTGERTDSPVFLSLPELAEQDRSRLTPVPREFREEVERTADKRQVGRLGLLGWETQGFAWESEGRRLVGRAQFQQRAFSAARDTWSELRKTEPTDREANLMLGTIFQRLGDLAMSDQALRRVLGSPSATRSDRAEANALLARNDKSRWQSAWTGAETSQIAAKALRSKFLLDSYHSYRRAFAEDLNHFYSGLNALSLLTIALELIEKCPRDWSERFDTDEEAASEHKRLQRDQTSLAAAVGLSMEAARAQLAPDKTDIWLEISQADYKFLTASRNAQVVAAYEQALAEALDFHVESARAQLCLFRDLDLSAERVGACLAAFPPAPVRTSATPLRRAVVFTGHMIDAPGRPKPRFPQSCEEAARTAIRKAMTELAGQNPETVLGVAGGASGGDILFHEVCRELGIPSRLRLTLPPGPFLARSVADGGSDWIARFEQLLERHSVSTEVLSDTEELPGWLQRKGGYDVWQRTNIWLLQEALSMNAPENVLVALWDGQPGDGPGGTQHLVEIAGERGFRTIVLNTADICR